METNLLTKIWELEGRQNDLEKQVSSAQLSILVHAIILIIIIIILIKRR